LKKEKNWTETDRKMPTSIKKSYRCQCIICIMRASAPVQLTWTISYQVLFLLVLSFILFILS